MPSGPKSTQYYMQTAYCLHVGQCDELDQPVAPKSGTGIYETESAHP